MSLNFKALLIAAVSISSFCSSFMSSSLNIAVAAISYEYHISPELLTYAVSAYVIAITAFLLPAASLANRLGFRRTYRIGTFTASATAAVAALMPEFSLFVTVRFVQGLFNALIFSTGIALLSYHTEGRQRGSAIGINVAAVYAGITLSPSLGGVLTDMCGWQSLFFISSAGYLLAFFGTLRTPHDSPTSRQLPYFKCLASSLSLLALLYGLTVMFDEEWGKYLAAGGALAFSGYLYRERYSRAPLLPVTRIYANKPLFYAIASALFNYLTTFCTALLLSMHFQLIGGLSATHTGLILMLQPALQCLLSPLAGRLTATINPHLLVTCGMLSSTLTMAMLIFLYPGTPLYYILAAQILGGLGYALFSAPNTTIIMNSVQRADFALASSLQSLARNLGMSLATVLLTCVFMLYINASPDSTLYLYELNFSTSRSFALATFMGILGILTCILGFDKHDKNLKSETA